MTDIRQRTIKHLLEGLDETEAEKSEPFRKLLGDDNEHVAIWGKLILERPKHPLDAFGEAKPDVLTEPEGDEAPPRRPSSPLVLGTYTLGFHRPNPQPGTITLYADNLKNFFHSLLWELHREFPNYPADLGTARAVAEWAVDKTYWHERFHHSMDVLRFLFRIPVPSLPSLQEEALAVAFSRRWLTERYRFASHRTLPSVLWTALMDLGFRYTSPGYRDWGRYADEPGFRWGVMHYLLSCNKSSKRWYSPLWGNYTHVQVRKLLALGIGINFHLLVKPREIVYTFFEQFRVFFLPVFEGLDG